MSYAPTFAHTRQRRGDLSYRERFWQISWSLVLLVALTSAIGPIVLYSAAGGSWEPWADKQAIRLGVGLVLMLLIAATDIRFWLRTAYALYAITFVLLIVVEIKGSYGMGAQRWIDLGVLQFQPSEVMKVASILALARYYHGLTQEEIGRLIYLVPPLVLIAAPAALVMKQPDLGTALMLLAGGVIIMWLAGVRLWVFLLGALCVPPTAVFGWSMMHDYQKRRILTLFNPDNDPLGAGYHITQSKIALGSGGMFGKGYMNGTQSSLNFLPERQTDFIFPMMAEELGMMGALILLTLYVILILYGFVIAFRCRTAFSRLVAMGITSTFFLYVFINVAMVMGLIPVVGVPLPLISYGGTALLNLLLGFGLLQCVYVNRDVSLPKRGAFDM
ncbi:rod shape-determining protein RodA [Phaeovibrio sulfidiphilus]|uniref:Peptidoglycan glycosyltransferase MrdB n=1 Tax=Phaeovibrio sulfidiphilus TaxID=1220600 RepID=A0A8J6YVT8_9PROT|nr:rod shape-determining protein RodA [Phaeovibrio sulfidiphilus]MBE1237349.1 rod shape-determining protein RodA [Phaeovibrio sulfidiphilus]